MRPHVRRHIHAATALLYDDSRSAEILDGTLPYRGPAEAIADFESLRPRQIGNHRPYLHLTLSAPDGIRIEAPLWGRIIRHTLFRLDFPPDRMPFLAFRHSDAAQDHAHVSLVRGTFLGAFIHGDLSEETSARIHRELTTRLALPPVDYPILSPFPRLESRAPKRRARKPDLARLHDLVGEILTTARPRTESELADFLMPYGYDLEREETVDGRIYATFCPIGGSRFSLPELKPDLHGPALLARLAHVSAIDSVSRLVQNVNLVRSAGPAARRILEETHHDRENEFVPSGAAGTAAVAYRDRVDRGRDAAPVARPAQIVTGSRASRDPGGPGGGVATDLRRAIANAGDAGGMPGEAGGNRGQAGRIVHASSPADPMNYAAWLARFLAALRKATHVAGVVYHRIAHASVAFEHGSSVAVLADAVRLERLRGTDIGAARRFAAELAVEAARDGAVLQVEPILLIPARKPEFKEEELRRKAHARSAEFEAKNIKETQTDQTNKPPKKRSAEENDIHQKIAAETSSATTEKDPERSNDAETDSLEI